MATKVTILLWKWWDERNRRNAGERPKCVDQVCQIVMEFLHMLSIPNPVQRTANKPKPKWSRPPPGILKINTDGAYVQETKKGAWGFIIRDYTGEHILAGAGNAGYLQSALMAETVGCPMF